MSNNSTAKWAETTVPEVVRRQAKATATDCLPGTVGCFSVCSSYSPSVSSLTPSHSFTYSALTHCFCLIIRSYGETIELVLYLAHKKKVKKRTSANQYDS